MWQNLPVLVVVLWGGFTTNFIWCIILLARNRSAKQLAGAPAPTEDEPRFSRRDRLKAAMMVANYSLAALAGVIWYFQFFFYSMGETKMGKYNFSSWTIHMASIIIFGTIWGFALKEWRGTSFRARGLVMTGLILLVASTIIVGYGNFIKANETTGIAVSTR